MKKQNKKSRGPAIATAVIVLLIIVLLSSCVSCSTGSEEKKPEDPVVTQSVATTSNLELRDVTKDELAELVAIVESVSRKKGLNLTFPDILATSEWLAAYDKLSGFYTVTTTAKDQEGNDDIVSMWLEYHGNEYSVHYFSDKNGTYIDDGKVVD